MFVKTLPLNMFGHVPPLPIKLCLNIALYGYVLLLFIAMTHEGCCLKRCTVTKIAMTSRKACLGRTPPPRPLKQVRARTPQSQTNLGTYLPPIVNQTLSRHDVIWQPTVTIYSDDSCRV